MFRSFKPTELKLLGFVCAGEVYLGTRGFVLFS